MTHIEKENGNNENGCVDRKIGKPEIRIFPNSKAKEFGTNRDLVNYLKDELSTKGTGIYYFRSYRQVKCIPGNSWALFRFEDLILGCAKIKEPAVSKKNRVLIRNMKVRLLLTSPVQKFLIPRLK